MSNGEKKLLARIKEKAEVSNIIDTMELANEFNVKETTIIEYIKKTRSSIFSKIPKGIKFKTTIPTNDNLDTGSLVRVICTYCGSEQEKVLNDYKIIDLTLPSFTCNNCGKLSNYHLPDRMAILLPICVLLMFVFLSVTATGMPDRYRAVKYFVAAGFIVSLNDLNARFKIKKARKLKK